MLVDHHNLLLALLLVLVPCRYSGTPSVSGDHEVRLNAGKGSLLHIHCFRRVWHRSFVQYNLTALDHCVVTGTLHRATYSSSGRLARISLVQEAWSTHIRSSRFNLVRVREVATAGSIKSRRTT